MTPRYLLPYPSEQIGGLPADLELLVWDGAAAPPPQHELDAVEFFCLPYMRHPAALALLPKLPALRTVQTLTAGTDDVLPLLPPGVAVCNARGLHDASTAELAMALILASLRGIPDFVRNQAGGVWDQSFHPALADRTVLVVGYGAIGAALEARLAPFECQVLRVARTARESARGPVSGIDELPGLLPGADVVVLLTPLTPETRQLVDADFLARMKPDALLVNVSRGPVVDTAALLAELESGRLSAALDVTEPEPLPADDPLWRAPRTLITPHVGGPSSAFLPRALRLLRSQLLLAHAGKPLANTVG